MWPSLGHGVFEHREDNLQITELSLSDCHTFLNGEMEWGKSLLNQLFRLFLCDHSIAYMECQVRDELMKGY